MAKSILPNGKGKIADSEALPQGRRAVEKDRQDAKIAKRLGIRGGDVEKNFIVGLGGPWCLGAFS
jgi:hypothetical protein